MILVESYDLQLQVSCDYKEPSVTMQLVLAEKVVIYCLLHMFGFKTNYKDICQASRVCMIKEDGLVGVRSNIYEEYMITNDQVLLEVDVFTSSFKVERRLIE